PLCFPPPGLPSFPTRRSSDLGQDALDFGVDFLRRLLPVEAAFGADWNIEEARALVAIVVDGAERLAHAELGDHRAGDVGGALQIDRKSTRLNSSHDQISYAVF